MGNLETGFDQPTEWLKRSDSPVNTWSGSGVRKWYSDLNADGLADYAWIPDGIGDLYVAYSTGNGFTKPKLWLSASIPNVGHPYSYGGYHEGIWDVNNDSFPDRVWIPYKGPKADLFVALSDHGNGFLPPQMWIEDISNGVYNRSTNGQRETYVDIDGDGILDRVWIPHTKSDLYVAKGIVSNGNLLLSVTNGQNVSSQFTYKVLTDASVYTQGTDATYPLMDFISPISVVSKLSTDDGLGGQRSVSYHYAGGKVDLNGRGFRGFTEVTQTDDSTGIRKKTFYKRDHRYISTKIVRTETRLANGTLIEEVDYTTDLKDYGNGVNFSRVKQVVKKEYETDGKLKRQTSTSNEFDDCGNAELVTINTHDGVTETTRNNYINSSSCTTVAASGRWLLGQLSRATVTRSVAGQAAKTRVTAYEYDADSGLMTKAIVEPGQASCKQEIYTHDAMGNVVQDTTQACTSSNPSFTARSQYYTFDAQGRFVVKERNALGHEQRKVFDKFGNLIEQTGPNGLTTRRQYDGFGRAILETLANGAWTQTAYLRNAGDSVCPAKAAYYTQTQTAGGNISYQCFDKLGQNVREATFGFDGQLILVDTDYDSRGLVLRQSEPYFSTQTQTRVWTRFKHDVMGRPTEEISPDGSVTRIAYQGLKTITTNALGQRQTEEYDARGKLLKSTDHFGKSVSYIYDGFGNKIEMRDSLGNITKIDYDVLGHKSYILDPDTGLTRYIHNALGELQSQTDAKGQVIRLRYDLLGRMVERNAPEGVSHWEYDTADMGVGKLAKMTGADGYQRINHYDSFGRLAQTDTLMEGQWYSLSTQFDQYGRVAAKTYPTGFAVKHEYNDYGYLSNIQRTDRYALVWQAQAMNAQGQLEQQRFGNGLVTQQTYDPLTGFVQRIQTTGLQSLHYTFDVLGNLLERRKGTNQLESFKYDGLNRLIYSRVLGAQAIELQYDEIGNIRYKTDVGAYRYGENGAGPHAVTTAGGITYRYDAVGNRISASNGQQITYSSFNKPTQITQGTTNLSFKYNPEHARYQQTIVRNGQTTELLYLDKLFEQETKNGVAQYKSHIFAGGVAVAVHSEYSNGTSEKMRYLHRDHLGSIESITDERGQLDNSLSFDAWGQRRSEQWGVLSEQEALELARNMDLHRGFTGHEHLDEVNLIHMNGRVYDPRLGRFLSADPVVQAPNNMQSLNRYSYVLNNPLSYTDPSGFFFKKLWRGIKKVAKKVVNFVKDNWKPILISAAGAVLGAVTGGIGGVIFGALGNAVGGVLGTAISTLGPAVLSGAGSGFGSAFAGSLLSGGSLKTALKEGLKGAAIGGLTAFANKSPAALFKPLACCLFNSAKIANFVSKASGIIMHGVVSGVKSELHGGSFGKSFLKTVGRKSLGLLSAAYKHMVGEDPKLLGIGKQFDMSKTYWQMPTLDALNFGMQGARNHGKLLAEGSPLTTFIARYIPFMNAISGAHDVMQVKWTGYSEKKRKLLNIPYMPVAALLTIGAYFGNK